LRSDKLRRRIALADAKIFAQCRAPTVGRGHHLTGTIASDLSGGIAFRALHVVPLMSNITTFEPDRGGLGDYRSVRSGLVAVKDQIAFHRKLSAFGRISDNNRRNTATSEIAQSRYRYWIRSRLDRYFVGLDPSKQMFAGSIYVVHIGPASRRLFQYHHDVVLDQVGPTRARIIRRSIKRRFLH